MRMNLTYYNDSLEDEWLIDERWRHTKVLFIGNNGDTMVLKQRESELKGIMLDFKN